MRILFSEWWVWPWLGQVFAERLRELGADVHPFKEHVYFQTMGNGLPGRAGRVWLRVQQKFSWGPALARLNGDLLRRAAELRPDVVFLWRGEMVWPETLRELRRRGALVVGHNNDNPFSPVYPRHYWRHLRAGFPHYDIYFAYRKSDLAPYREHGCREVDLLRSCYIREVHRPLPDVRDSPYACDVAFVGHWEPDGRDVYLKTILDDAAIRLRVFGCDSWQRSAIRAQLAARGAVGTAALGQDYNLALNSAKIALVFLSRKNQDTYTRRCFEIPAAGAFMLSQYSDDLESLYREGVEAEYFRSPEELRDKVRFYLKNEAARQKIARAGHERVRRDGHEVLDRARHVMTWLRKLLPQEREPLPA